ncbi:MAG: tetratricopeptide repeat protein [Nocardioides sp.]
MSDQFPQRVPPLTVSAPREAATAYRTAHELLSDQSPREALDVLTPALDEDPGNTGLRSLRAWAYLQRAQLGRAEEDLRAVVEQVPDDVWARHALGRSLERQHRLAEALPHLKLAAVMSGEVDHEVAVLRVERRLVELGERDAGSITPEG